MPDANFENFEEKPAVAELDFIFALMPVYQLRELNQHIRETIEENYPENLWVRAEIASLNINQTSGHCYLELADSGGSQTAKIKGMVWRKTFTELSEKFRRESGKSLEAGMQVQVLVKVEFSVQFGMSLIIWDIDPAFTVGDLAMKKAQTLNHLRKEGLLDKNKRLVFPFPADRIALITSATAAGYEDFCKHLLENPFGFRYSIRLFPAMMQGTEAIPSLRQAFSEVKKEAGNFDFVVLIRGGGSRLDLQVFDEFEVAAALADCPIPVLTGIGHERDDSICDQVAARFFKTPTAVADFLIGQSSEAEAAVNQQINRISSSLQWAVRSREMDMEKSLNQISQALSRQANRMDTKLRQEESRVSLAAQRKLHQLETNLVSLETMLKAGNPSRILELGYARIFQDGKRKKSKAEISVSSPLKIQLKDGEIHSNPF